MTDLILPKAFKEVIHYRSYVNVLNLRLYYKNAVVILVPVDAQQLCTSTGPRVNLVPRSSSTAVGTGARLKYTAVTTAYRHTAGYTTDLNLSLRLRQIRYVCCEIELYSENDNGSKSSRPYCDVNLADNVSSGVGKFIFRQR